MLGGRVNFERCLRSRTRRDVARSAFLVVLAAFALGSVPAHGSPANVRTPTLDWAVAAGGALWDEGHGIAVDPAGNSYVTGVFGYFGGGPAVFGSGDAAETTLDTPGFHDAFLASYDRHGALRWAVGGGAATAAWASGVAADPAGNTYVVGEFVGTLVLGAGDPNETTLVSAGFDLFVASYDRNGSLRWARRDGGAGYDGGGYAKVGVDGAGHVYVTGDFTGTATFGAGEPGETELVSTGQTDVFLASYDRDGALRWARGAGGLLNERGSALAVTPSGDVVISGIFVSRATSITFGQGEPTETTFTSKGFADVYLARFDRDGNLRWARQIGSPLGSEFGYGLDLDAAGNAYLTGFFRGIEGDAALTFGEGDATETTLVNAAGSPSAFFLASYDRLGVLRWAKMAESTGGMLGAGGFGIAADAQGNAYVTGDFDGSLVFGAGEPGEVELVAGGEDIFVASFGPDGSVRWARREGDEGPFSIDGGYGLALDRAGNVHVTGRIDGTATFGGGEPRETTLTADGGPDIFVARYGVHPPVTSPRG